jgi:paraquat-inducible protein B
MTQSRGLYLRVGALVLAGAALAVLFVIFLAGRQSGPAVLFETYTEESVQGLDIGAPVRFRGVRIGRVTEVGLVSANYRRPEGSAFTMGFQLVVVRFAIDPSTLGETPSLEEAIRLGMRTRITAQGITGVNYLELDFLRSQQGVVPPALPWTPRHPVIPSVPSTFQQARAAAETLIERLTILPIEQMAADVAGLLSNLNRQTGDGDAARALAEVAATASLLRAALEAGDLAGAMADIRAAAGEARRLMAAPELRGALQATTAAANDLRRTAQRLPGAVDSFERTMRSARETTIDVQAELLPILIDLRAATASLRATAEQLRASPSQALFGAPPTPERRR